VVKNELPVLSKDLNPWVSNVLIQILVAIFGDKKWAHFQYE